MSKSRQKIEYGDFQTPMELAQQVCELVANSSVAPASVIEPTCGRGSMLLAALDRVPDIRSALGVDLNGAHLRVLDEHLAIRADRGKVRLLEQSFFDAPWASLVSGLPQPLLVIGNPPWVTNAELGVLESSNLPLKVNSAGHRGLDAVTGKSNFDVSEWILTRIMEWLDGRTAVMAMLCKSAVARKVLGHAWRNEFQLAPARIYGIDAIRWFGAAVDACLLLCEFKPAVRETQAAVYASLDAEVPRDRIGWRDGQLIADLDAYERSHQLRACRPLRACNWRSGIKHDCASIMELRRRDEAWTNKLGEAVELEFDYLFPMLKSSEVASGRTSSPRQWMLVTQSTINAPTDTIQSNAPKTWNYLTRHADRFDRRRSTIYRNRPRFAIFGVGDYAFTPWKVAISGLYKELCFRAVGPFEGKPVVFDDTVNFLPCQSEDEALFLVHLLHFDRAQEFYRAFVFWDNKRPITVELLRRLDLRRSATAMGELARFNQLFGASIASSESGRLF